MDDRPQPIDSTLLPSAQLAHLNLTQVQQHIAAARARGRYSGVSDPVEFLIQQHCVADLDGTLFPTVAAMLALSDDRERWLHGTSGVGLAQFSGPEPRSTTLSFIEQVRGPIFTVIERTVELLWARSEHDYRVDGALRIEAHAYPRVVLRELTVNALCHRDWGVRGSRVRIQMFPQAIEWISPGGLPEGVTIANLLDMQIARNPILAALLFQAGYIEGFGLGMDTVYAALRDNHSLLPDLEDTGHVFTVRIAARLLRRTSAPTPTSTTEQRQAAITALLEQRGPLTAVQLASAVRASRRTLLRDLNDLIVQGKVKSVGATRNQRYAHVEQANSRHGA